MYKEAGGERERQTDRQTGRQTETDRQTDRQRQTDTENTSLVWFRNVS